MKKKKKSFAGLNPRHAVNDSIEHAPYTYILNQRFEHIGREKVIGTYLISYSFNLATDSRSYDCYENDDLCV